MTRGSARFRVFFLNSVRETSFGGGERWMLTIASALSERGHDVLIGGRAGSSFLQRAEQQGLRTRDVRVRGEADPATLLGLRGLFRQEHPDVVVANFNKDVRLAGIARLPGSKPKVLARNGLAILPNNVRYRHTYFRLADAIVTNTESIRTRYVGYGWVPRERVHVVHNGIQVPSPDGRTPFEIRQSLGLPPLGRWIGAFGRMVTQKRFDLFLEAVAKIREQIPDLQALLVGEGPERDALERLAAEHGLADIVHFAGFQTAVWDWYRACDLVALTSASEGLPNAVLEAMALERPPIAFDVGGVREMIADPSVGRVVPPGDVGALVAAAVLLLSDDETRLAVGKSAARRVMAEFSIEAMATRFESILRGLVGPVEG
ncbi:MAG: glycosyltransferase [Candidatus Eisenbacteria bacterium]|nr:glycosyltransferase [Candidatus Eisenbacteria bacterium]